MIEFGLSAEALGATRLGFSPLGELACSLRALDDRGAASMLRPWLRHAPDRVAREDLRLLGMVASAAGVTPDFLYPVSADRGTVLEDQLVALSALSQGAYDADLARVWAPDSVPAPLQGKAGRARLIQALRSYDENVLAPVRPHLRAALDAEIAHRSERALHDGLYGVFEDLHPEVRVDGARLTVAKGHHSCVGVVRASITLVPSVFAWPRLVVVDRSPDTVQLHYPVREIGRVWHNVDSASPNDDALAALLGSTRARILLELAVPRSTTQVARRLGTSPGGTSTHLSVLRRNGLVTTTRDGRSVLYRRTALGASIVAASCVTREAQ